MKTYDYRNLLYKAWIHICTNTPTHIYTCVLCLPTIGIAGFGVCNEFAMIAHIRLRTSQAAIYQVLD